MSNLKMNFRKRKHLKHFPHKCSHCGRGFFTRQELEAHVRTHTGDKPYVCQLCKKGFARAHHVKRHMNTVHSEKKQIKLDFMDETEIEETETHLEVKYQFYLFLKFQWKQFNNNYESKG